MVGRGAQETTVGGFVLVSSPPFTLVSMSSPRKKEREKKQETKDTSIKTTEIGGGGEDERNDIHLSKYL